MLVVNDDTNKGNVEFVSYTGKYPNLCNGVLTLLIDGQEVKFGHEYANYNWKSSKYSDNNYDDFWHSGGNCGFTNEYSEEYINREEWKIKVDELPDKFKKYAAEIDRVFNANVPFGCCGGCL